MTMNVPDPPRIAGPVVNPRSPRIKPPPGAWDTHAHIFGPAQKFPYQPGRGYTPPDAPVEHFIALLDHLGFANGLVVQGNAHVYDNSVVLDALTRFPQRLRGVAITDTRIAPEVLPEWDRAGMRGLRFHLIPAAAELHSLCSRCSARPWPSSAGSCSFSAITGCCRKPRQRCARLRAT
jgi:2-pyrone-4,6-dicarboxylate lactonase